LRGQERQPCRIAGAALHRMILAALFRIGMTSVQTQRPTCEVRKYAFLRLPLNPRTYASLTSVPSEGLVVPRSQKLTTRRISRTAALLGLCSVYCEDLNLDIEVDSHGHLTLQFLSV